MSGWLFSDNSIVVINSGEESYPETHLDHLELILYALIRNNPGLSPKCLYLHIYQDQKLYVSWNYVKKISLIFKSQVLWIDLDLIIDSMSSLKNIFDYFE